MILLLIIPLKVCALDYCPNLNSESAVVYDMTNDKVLCDVNGEEKRSVASLTKIMTAIVAIENIDNLDEHITITDDMLADIYWNASVSGLKVGDEVTYRDLLYATILPSGADAAHSLAISISGNIENFVNLMNDLAKKIGMNDTHFINVTGLDVDGQYSTASDIMLLLNYSLKNDTFKEIYTTKEHILSNGLKVSSTVMYYGNKMNVDTSRILGSKTGNTDEAGLCFSAYFEFEDNDIALVTLGAQSIDGKFYNVLDALNIIDYVDNNYVVEIPVLEESSNNEQALNIDNSNKKNPGIKTIIFILIILFIIFNISKRRKHKKSQK